MLSTASGVPSGSASSTRSAPASTASAGTSSVTGIGHGVPSASVAEAATEATSALVMKPRSGANAPDRISSRSPSCRVSSVSDASDA